MLVTAQAATKPSAAEAQPAKAAAPGVELAQTLSTITGVAISPLLGVSAVGAWKYFHTPSEKRAKLPWFAQPWFWVPAFLLVALCLAKDTLGTAAPTALNKPFDVADTVEHKISGLVATGAFVPFIAAVYSAPDAATASLSAAGFAALDLHWLYNAILVPIAMVVFFVVFLASNAINILILLSPFTTVDAALKGFRLFLLSTVTVTAFANPWVGALCSLVIVVIAYFIAGWSFRLSVLGTLFVWDLVSFRRTRFTPNPAANWLFLGRKTNQVPARTYGRLVRHEPGQLRLHYRPWLVLPARTLTLPAGQYTVGQGLLYSEVVRVDGDEVRTALLLPPRYRSHEAELAKVYGFAGVRPIGLRAAFRWLKELLGFKPSPQPAAA